MFHKLNSCSCLWLFTSWLLMVLLFGSNNGLWEQIHSSPSHLPALYVSASGHVVQLTDRTFEAKVKDGLWLVAFTAPWCGHCKKLKPELEKAAQMVHAQEQARKAEDLARFRFAEVDVTHNDGLKLKYNVNSFPTLIYFLNGEANEHYKGGRSADSLLKFAMKMQQPSPLRISKAEQLKKLVFESSELRDVKYEPVSFVLVHSPNANVGHENTQKNSDATGRDRDSESDMESDMEFENTVVENFRKASEARKQTHFTFITSDSAELRQVLHLPSEKRYNTPYLVRTEVGLEEPPLVLEREDLKEKFGKDAPIRSSHMQMNENEDADVAKVVAWLDEYNLPSGSELGSHNFYRALHSDRMLVLGFVPISGEFADTPQARSFLEKFKKMSSLTESNLTPSTRERLHFGYLDSTKWRTFIKQYIEDFHDEHPRVMIVDYSELKFYEDESMEAMLGIEAFVEVAASGGVSYQRLGSWGMPWRLWKRFQYHLPYSALATVGLLVILTLAVSFGKKRLALAPSNKKTD